MSKKILIIGTAPSEFIYKVINEINDEFYLLVKDDRISEFAQNYTVYGFSNEGLTLQNLIYLTKSKNLYPDKVIICHGNIFFHDEIIQTVRY